MAYKTILVHTSESQAADVHVAFAARFAVLREILLGGVSRAVLHGMCVPTLMAH